MSLDDIIAIEHQRQCARVDEVLEYLRDHGTIEDVLGDLLYEMDEDQLKEIIAE